MAMGPAFNLVLAVLLVAGGYLLGVRIPAWLRAPVLVEHVVAGSPAAEAGLRAGDLVLQVDGRPAPDWKAFQDLVVLRPGAAVDFLVQRDGRELIVPVTIAARTKHAIGWVGAEPCHAVVVHSLSDGSPADRGGLRPGDVVVSVDGEAPCSDAGLIDLIQAAAGAPQRFVVSRDGSELALVVQAEMKPATERWMIGVAPALQLSGVVTERHGIGAALKASVQKNWEDATLVVGTVARLLTGRLSLRTTSGPLELAGIAANTADLGFVPFLNLMALVSLNLGILNLLPIPVLDGGRIVVLLFEGVRGRDLSARTKEWILQAGVVMILALMGLVLFFDLVKKLEG
jgi:regulator of sigma E protease